MKLFLRTILRILPLAWSPVFAVAGAPGSERQFVDDWVQGVFLQGGPSEANDVPKLGGAEFGPSDIPFSFVYGGKASSQFLSTWKRSRVVHASEAGKRRWEVIYTDPTTGLEIRCEATTFADFPAVEWVLHLRNSGGADTPILEKILPLDLKLQAPAGPVVFHHSHGSNNLQTDFVPVDEAVGHGADIALAPQGGRSSSGNLPFFNLEWNGGGLVGAIGWTGQWALRLQRDPARGLRLAAGQELTHLTLHPGETIRTPSILLVAWAGDDRFRGYNLLRRLLLAHYYPRVNGEVALPPVSQTSWFTWNEGNEVTEANQIASMPTMAEWGVETYWLDAGWFEGGWPKGAGSWVPKPDAFPRGLKPLSDAAHRSGLKFLLWFEPERVTQISRIAREHPQWVLPGKERGGLLNLGDPAARVWLTDFLSRAIDEWGVDIYRNDFNIEPLPFWRALDRPDRQGMAEIRYVEGLYQWWDDLRARHPGLLIDNCASGGRRLDIEMFRRSYALWRNDGADGEKAEPALNQSISEGLSLYVPLQATSAWRLDPYHFRSVATTGVNFCMDTRARSYSAADARRMTSELKALRPLYLGDYYPLTSINADDRQWCAWQFNRPELGRGFAVFFRRPASGQKVFVAGLHGLDLEKTYAVTFVDARRTQTLSGSQLAALRVELPQAATSLLVTYRTLSAPLAAPSP